MSQHGLSVAQWFMDLGRWLFSIDIYRLLLHAFYVIFIARFSSIICVARHKKNLIPRECKRLDYNCKVWGEPKKVMYWHKQWRKCFTAGDLLSDTTTTRFNWERHEMICMEHMDLYEWSRWIYRCFWVSFMTTMVTFWGEKRLV